MNSKKKISYVVIAILCLVITITGATYAFFALQVSNNNITGTTASVGLVLNVDKISPVTQGVDDLIPQLESALGTAINNSHKCKDGNNNIVCQVYKATITNNGNSNVKLKGTITFTGISNLPHLKWKMITDATTIGSGTGVTASTTATDFVQEVTLAPNAHQDYYFVIWIDETNSTQNESGTFGATLAFNSSDGQGLTSTIGAEPEDPVDVYFAYDNNLFNYQYISFNEYIPSGTSSYQYDNAVDAIARQGLLLENENFPACLGFKLNNDLVEKEYVVFTITPEMVSDNATEYPGMTAGTYYLRGGVNESLAFENGGGGINTAPVYKENIDTLKRAFGASNSGCLGLDYSSENASCIVTGLEATVYADGGVYSRKDGQNCSVAPDGAQCS